MDLLTLMGENAYRLGGNSQILHQEITGVTADPYRAGEGVLFVCTRTALRDGHRSVASVYARGCRAFLADCLVALPEDAAVLTVPDAEALLGPLAARLFAYPAQKLSVFGITGTAGKSAVALTLSALLERAGQTVASLTTDGLRIGHTLRPAGNVVPDAAELQEWLHSLVQSGVTAAVLELSAYMLAHKAAFSIPFAAILLTNLSTAHVGTLEFPNEKAYCAAKLSLLECPSAVTVLPASMKALASRAVTFGEQGDFQALEMSPLTERSCLGTSFVLRFPNGEKQAVSLPVPGDFAIDNALAAAALATAAGLDPAMIAAGLSDIVPAGRMELAGARAGRYVFVDAAFEAEALGRALQTLRGYTAGRLTVVIGSVGGRATWRRAPLGRTAAAMADFVYLTADDPDSEDPMAICRDMVDEDAYGRFALIPDRRRAIQRAVLEMRPGDVLLIAGKGACQSQLIHGIRTPFLEKEIVKEAIERL